MTDNRSFQVASNLRKGIIQTFSLSELRILCADLDIDYEELEGDTKETKVLDLIAYMNHRGQIAKLLQYCIDNRPMYPWPQEAGTQQPLSQIHENPAAGQPVAERLAANP